MKMFWVAAAVLTLQASQAVAQAPTPPQRVAGIVSAVTDTTLTVTKADGSNATVDLLPNRTVTIIEPITVDQITPGSYVATANKTQPDGTGVSVEIRVFPPSTPRFDVNRAMDASGETMMTNGSVAKAVSVDGGQMLTIDYGNGTRQVKVPPGISITLNTPASPDVVKAGVKVDVSTTAPTADRPGRQSIRIAKADLRP
jgi:hypothetical protein